jgi:predicted nucleotidyltransferase
MTPQGSTEEIADHVKGIADSYGYNLNLVLIFGSYATGDATEGSDVDIVVVSPDFEETGYYSRATDFHFNWNTERYPVPDLILLTPDEFEERREKESDIVAIADREGIRF